MNSFRNRAFRPSDRPRVASATRPLAGPAPTRAVRAWALPLAVLAALLLAGPLLGQVEPFDLEDPPAATATRGSLVGAFFVSRKTDPITNEESVELLGSLVIWFLLVLSVVSVGLIGHLALTNQRKAIVPPGVSEEVARLVKSGKFKEVIELTGADQSFLSQILHAGLAEASHGFSAVVRAVEQTAEELTTNLLRRIEYLNVLGQVSPMIGLFGTVYGMILAFHAIVQTGGNADPILLAGGISTALTTTFWGLVVAIPALAGYAILRNRIDAYTTEATLVAEELLNHFRPKPRSRGGARPSGSAPPAEAASR
ncbi:MAG: MotA/TolQ/ExbB proton channel family protein [Planctomycetota bacterium]|jgi:biopolymer transport protein ExbB